MSFMTKKTQDDTSSSFIKLNSEDPPCVINSAHMPSGGSCIEIRVTVASFAISSAIFEFFFMKYLRPSGKMCCPLLNVSNK